MQKTKSIVLPSGARCQVRAAQMAELIFASGKLSVLEFQNVMSDAVEKQRDGKAKELTRAEWDVMLTWRRALLLRCVGRLTHPGGLKQRIVDKPFDECGPDEIAPELLSDEDVQEIVDQIESLVVLPKEAATNVATFPTEPDACVSPGRNGEALREVADGPPVAG